MGCVSCNILEKENRDILSGGLITYPLFFFGNEKKKSFTFFVYGTRF
jgi:hypothetical protein